jgi:hypothetical protein
MMDGTRVGVSSADPRILVFPSVRGIEHSRVYAGDPYRNLAPEAGSVQAVPTIRYLIMARNPGEETVHGS